MDEIEEAKARLERLAVRSPDEIAAPAGPVEGDIGPPPDGPVPIVGDPGWIQPAKTQTTTEIVAALQRRYPGDPEVRALIGKVTDAGVSTANERMGRAIGWSHDMRAKLDRYEAALTWYANADYLAGVGGDGSAWPSEADTDGGERARKALAGDDE